MKKIQVYLADDHLILRQSLAHILNQNEHFEIIGENGDGLLALREIEKKQPDIVILDISMPSMNGLEITRHLRKYNPQIKIVILSQYEEEEYIQRLLEYRVDGYLLKDRAIDDLVTAMHEAMKGNIFLSPQISKKIISDNIFSDRESKTKNKFMGLSNREREIIKLISDGKSNEEIGNTLFISPKTVRTHRARIMKKLDIHNVAELMTYAIKNKIINF